MLDFIKTVLESYLICKRHTGPNPQFCHNVPAHNKPFNVVNMNLISPLPVAAGVHSYILIAVNHLTKCVETASSSSA